MRRQTWTGLVLAALAGCSSPAERLTVPTADSSRTALDWPGIYVGTLPCAACGSIHTRIELRADGTFSLLETPRGNDSPPFNGTGTFVWDSTGSRITLDIDGVDGRRYLVGENALLQLDRTGQPINGALTGAYAYRLAKTVDDSGIENRRWALVELNGEPWEIVTDSEPVYLELDSEQLRVTGNAPCNRFFGTYERATDTRLQFGSDIGATRRACGQLDRERELFAMLERVDSYAIVDGMLVLQGTGVPLARFYTED